MRPVLRPGCTLLRRDPTHVQVGIEPGRAVVLRDSPRLRQVVARLDGVRDDRDVVADVVEAMGEPRATRRLLEALTAAGVVVDAEPVRTAPAPAEVAHQLARAEHPATAAARADDRARARVEVDGAGSLAGTVAELLTASGVGSVLTTPDPAPGRQGSARPDAVVLVGGAAPGARADRLVTAGVPHLPVAVIDGTAVLGPFVLPGRTGCLRCVDAARTARDPSWPALAAQLSPAPPDPPGMPAPHSPVLESALGAWCVREVLAHLSHGQVLTYGASLRFDDDLVEQVRHTWPLHPRCGCALLS